MAVLLLFARHEFALMWSAVAGFGLLIWIMAEIFFIHAFTWAQTLYVVSGMIDLVLVLVLLGVAPWLPRGQVTPTSGQLTSAAPTERAPTKVADGR